MDVRDYAARAGMKVSAGAVREAQQELWRVLESVQGASVPAKPSGLDRLFTYRVPKRSADAGGGRMDVGRPELERTPYDLGRTLGGRGAGTTLRLLALNELASQALKMTLVDWLGVYQARELGGGRALVKVASRGVASRAELPLTTAFAKKNGNAAVGLSGQARVLDDVQAHVDAGGAYGACDPAVQSAACVPVFSEVGVLLGTVAAESVRAHFFDEERLAAVVALALEVGAHFP